MSRFIFVLALLWPTLAWSGGSSGPGGGSIIPGANLSLGNVTSNGKTHTISQWLTAAPTALVDGSSIAVDASTGYNFSVTIAGNRTLANPTNLYTGQTVTFFVTQDGTGGRILSYGNNYNWMAGGPAPLNSTANALTIISCIADTTASLQCATGANNAPAVVQSQSAAAEGNTGVPAVITFSTTPTVGNLLIFFIGGFNATWTPPAGVFLQQNVNQGNEAISIYTRTVQSGDGTSWSFSTASNNFQAYGMEVANASELNITSLQLGNPPSAALQTGPITGRIRLGTMTYGLFTVDTATLAGTLPGTGYTVDAILETASHPLAIMHATSGWAGYAPAIQWNGPQTGQDSVAMTMGLH